MGIVNEAVQDGIGVGIVTDGVMAGRHWKLAGHDGGAAAIAIFEDLEQILASLAAQPALVCFRYMSAGFAVTLLGSEVGMPMAGTSLVPGHSAGRRAIVAS
jgi:hypothetical protein